MQWMTGCSLAMHGDVGRRKIERVRVSAFGERLGDAKLFAGGERQHGRDKQHEGEGVAEVFMAYGGWMRLFGSMRTDNLRSTGDAAL